LIAPPPLSSPPSKTAGASDRAFDTTLVAMLGKELGVDKKKGAVLEWVVRWDPEENAMPKVSAMARLLLKNGSYSASRRVADADLPSLLSASSERIDRRIGDYLAVDAAARPDDEALQRIPCVTPQCGEPWRASRFVPQVVHQRVRHPVQLTRRQDRIAEVGVEGQRPRLSSPGCCELRRAGGRPCAYRSRT
jgi:hypothetical protein